MPGPPRASSSPVRVAHIITGLGIGGAEMMLTRLVGAMDPAVVRSEVVSMTGRGALTGAIEGHGVAVHALDMRNGRPTLPHLASLASLLRRLQPDIVQTWLYHADFAGLIAARWCGVRHVVWNIRCSSLDPQGAPSRRVLQRLLAAVSGWPAGVISNSLEGRRAHEAVGYHPKSWAIIPNGIDTRAFAPDAQVRAQTRAALGIAADEIVVGIAGRHHPMKDHATFLRAAAIVAAAEPRVRILMAGRGIADEPGLRVLADAVGEGRVLMAGERTDIAAVLNAVDIFTLSSAWGEGFPNVVAEAMACGVPVVSTDVGDAAAIVGRADAVVPPRSADGLAQAVLGLVRLGDAGRRARGAEGRARVEAEYDIVGIARRYEDVYTRLAATGRL